MQHTKTLFALLAVLALTAIVACQKEKDEVPSGNTDTVPTDTIPTPDPQPMSLVGTTWEGVKEDGGYTDKSVLHFITDSTGTEYTWLGSDNQTLMEATCDIVYHFDGLAMEGSYYAITPYGQGAPWAFTYSPADNTLTTHDTQGNNRIYHLQQEKVNPYDTTK